MSYLYFAFHTRACLDAHGHATIRAGICAALTGYSVAGVGPR